MVPPGLAPAGRECAVRRTALRGVKEATFHRLLCSASLDSEVARLFNCQILHKAEYPLREMIEMRHLAKQSWPEHHKSRDKKVPAAHVTFEPPRLVSLPVGMTATTWSMPSHERPLPLSPCRNRPHCGLLRLPIRRLRASHREAPAPAEHRDDAAHREDDRGGSAAPWLRAGLPGGRVQDCRCLSGRMHGSALGTSPAPAREVQPPVCGLRAAGPPGHNASKPEVPHGPSIPNCTDRATWRSHTPLRILALRRSSGPLLSESIDLC